MSIVLAYVTNVLTQSHDFITLIYMGKLLKNAFLTIAFDDSYSDTFKHAIKYLSGLKIKSTIAVPASFIGRTFENRPVAKLDELKASLLQGHEIASHTITHPNLLNLRKKSRLSSDIEITESKHNLEYLLNAKIESFVFPFINRNQTKGLQLVSRKYYKSSRMTADKPFFNKIPLKDPFSIKGFAIMKKHSVSFLNKQIDRAIKQKSWLIEVYHLVGKKNTLSAHRPKPYRYFTHIDDFKKHVEYAMSKGVTILTQKQAIKKLYHGL